jgi:two-component system, sensor histidine kinase SagS
LTVSDIVTKINCITLRCTAMSTPSSITDTSPRRLDALHQAGRDLAALDPDMLASLDGQSRIDFVKANILRVAKQVLGQDKVDIRLLNPTSNELEPLVSEGMRPEVAIMKLRAEPVNNGISGWVASKGREYYCPDSRTDPLNITGASDAKTCYTVPLTDQGRVMGVMSVESDQIDAFSDEDRATFKEFAQEIAAALHTLVLLSTERAGLANKSVELVTREVALPIDQILNQASALRDRFKNDPEATGSLDEILRAAREIKDTVKGAASSLCGVDPLLHMAPPPAGMKPFNLKILVAESDERYRKLAHSMLYKLGCTVEATRTASEALSQSRTTHYDMALVDIRLPDMTGYDLFCRLRAELPTLPVVLTTEFGYDSTHSILRARQDGLHGVLYKPFRMDQVHEVLSKEVVSG